MNRKYIIAGSLWLFAFTADQVTKVIIRAVLAPISNIEIIPGYVELRYAENTGIAFGLFNDLPQMVKLPLFSLITLVAVAIIIHLLRQAPERALRLPAALGLVLAGALGNLVDRFHWPGVVDFIRIQAWPPGGYYWPTFNVADMAISAGIILLIIDTLFTKDPDAPECAAVPGAEAGPGSSSTDQPPPEPGESPTPEPDER